jgi:hypothetical protein
MRTYRWSTAAVLTCIVLGVAASGAAAHIPHETEALHKRAHATAVRGLVTEKELLAKKAEERRDAIEEFIRTSLEEGIGPSAHMEAIEKDIARFSQHLKECAESGGCSLERVESLNLHLSAKESVLPGATAAREYYWVENNGGRQLRRIVGKELRWLTKRIEERAPEATRLEHEADVLEALVREAAEK